MKKFILFIVALFFICCTKTPTESENYPIQLFIRVTGSEGLLYSGTYGNSSMSIDVDGVVPTPVFIGDPDYVEYSTSIENSQDEAFADFRKEQAGGTLTVKIGTPISNWGFETKREASTFASYGSVYITWKPN